MQNRVFKFINLFFVGLFILSQASYSQDITTKIKEADSLFKARRYTQSLSIYEEVYQAEKKATPSMLLKMAYSNEAMDNVSEAMLYLHDYYRITADDKAIEKMNDLAQVNSLEGYNLSEFEQVKKVLEDFKLQIIGVLFALALLVLGMMYRKLKKHESKSPSLAIALAIVLGLIFYVVNLNANKTYALIDQNNAYLMSGPSAAAELVEVVNQGHKVEIIAKKDIWYEIKWRGGRAYVRENNLQELL